MPTNEEVIKDFIFKFSVYGQQVIDCFTTGNCYWFAKILFDRFGSLSDDAMFSIYYDDIDGHFVCKLLNKYWGINGEYKSDHELHSFYWWYCNDNERFERLWNQCVKKNTYNDEKETNK